MSWTQTDVDNLRRAIATGALSVRNANGELVTYRSLADMRSLLTTMEAEVAGATSTTAVRYIVPTYSDDA